MYVLIVYDVAVARVTKVYKFLKQFPHWRQNSVFEGELTDAQIEKVRNGLKNIIDTEADLILCYIARDEKWLKREHLGKDGKSVTNLI